MTQNKTIDFVLSLEENAKDSLIHGIEHFTSNERQTDLKYAVLHIAQAVELFLKARLAKEHFVLIYDKPENTDENSKTVDFHTLLKRLLAVGVNLSEQTRTDLIELQNYRNKLQHHRFSEEKTKVKERIGKGVRFLESFLEKELNFILENEVDELTYQVLLEAVYGYEERLRRAQEAMENDLPFDKDRLLYSITYCPECDEETIAYPNPKDDSRSHVECYFCGTEFRANECSRCGAILLDDEECKACLEYYMSKDD